MSPEQETRQASRTVAIVGTGNSELSPQEQAAVEIVMAAIVRLRCNVIVGDSSGVDLRVVEQWAQLVPEDTPEMLLQLWSANARASRKEAQSVHRADVRELIYQSDLDFTEKMLADCAVLVLIGGRRFGSEIFRDARGRRIPVLPIAWTGGNANTCYQRLKQATRIGTTTDAVALDEWLEFVIDPVMENAPTEEDTARYTDWFMGTLARLLPPTIEGTVRTEVKELDREQHSSDTTLDSQTSNPSTETQEKEVVSGSPGNTSQAADVVGDPQQIGSETGPTQPQQDTSTQLPWEGNYQGNFGSLPWEGSAEETEKPLFWIAVAGNSSEPSEWNAETKALAEALVTARIGVITTRYKGASRLFSEHYVQAAQDANLPIAQFLRHVVLTTQEISDVSQLLSDDNDISIEFDYIQASRAEGSIVKVRSREAQAGVVRDDATALILFGGKTHTKQLVSAIRESAVLVVPVSGSSRDFSSTELNRFYDHPPLQALSLPLQWRALRRALDGQTALAPSENAEFIVALVKEYYAALHRASVEPSSDTQLVDDFKLAGATEQATAPKPDIFVRQGNDKDNPSPPLAQAPTKNVITNVYNNLYQAARARTEELDDYTLDIFLAPGPFDKVAASTADAPLDLAERSYLATLTLRQPGGGDVVTFEGIFRWTGEQARAQSTGVALAKQLFAEAEPKANDGAVFRGEPGQKSLATGLKYALARANTGLLRFQLRIHPEVPELHHIPWELLSHPEEEGDPFAVWQQTPFARFLPVPTAAPDPAPLGPDEPIRVLVVYASPADLERPDAERPEPLRGIAPIDPAELKLFTESVNKVTRKIAFTVVETSVALSDVEERLRLARNRGIPFHALHVLCHGVPTGTGSPCLVLKAETSANADLVTENDLALRLRDYLAGADALRLIVLASCFTAQPQQKQALKGIAQRLVREGTPAVVAMQEALEFEAAQHFSQRLYERLAERGGIDQAVNAARRELFVRRADPRRAGVDRTVGRTQWGVPVLFLRRMDGQLFQRAVAPSEKPYDPDVPDAVQSEATTAVPFDDSRAARAGADPDRLMDAMLARISGQWPVKVSLGDTSLLRVALERGGDAPAPPPIAEPQRQRKNPELPAALLYRWLRGEDVAGEDACPKSFPRLRGLEPVVAQALAALRAGKHIILTGPPGTGKTVLAQALCTYAQQQGWCSDQQLVTATADWTTFDTIGGYTPNAQGVLCFRPGVFLNAIARDQWLIVDEINRAEIDKVFGELFTVLSGQTVTLPYHYGKLPLRIVKPGESRQNTAVSYDYPIHRDWRIIGTMNVYDKATLYAMSYAFMRRFAFIEVPLPERDQYRELLTAHLKALDCADTDDTPHALVTTLFEYDPDDPEPEKTYPIMHLRGLGPAIAKDVASYMVARYGSGDITWKQAFVEAVLLYVTPQLEGLPDSQVPMVYGNLIRQVQAQGNDAAQQAEARGVIPPLRKRFRMLFPFVTPEEWDAEEK